MRPMPLLKVLFLVLILLSFSYPGEAGSVAFYYKGLPSDEMWAAFQYIVMPRNVNLKDRKVFFKDQAQPIAYVSVGEVSRNDLAFRKIKRSWIIGKNRAWNSLILDIRNMAYRAFLINEVVTPAIDAGFNGIFLDTLDSYSLGLNKKDWASSREAEVGLIEEIRRRFPHIEIFINRGFEIVDKVHGLVDAVVVESLFRNFDPKTGRYRAVSKRERGILIPILNRIRNRYHLPIVVVDYLPPKKRDEMRETARKILNLGFIPYIADKDLCTVGIGPLEVVRRRVLLLYNGETFGDSVDSSAHRLLSLPLEYLGYIPDLWDVRKGLPKGYLVDRYAGIIVWLNSSLAPSPERFFQWVKKTIRNGNKILFFETFGFPADNEHLMQLGLRRLDISFVPGDLEVVPKRDYFNFEASPIIATDDAVVPKNGEPILEVRAKNGSVFCPIAKTPWGGYALGESFLVHTVDARWVVDPFLFLKDMVCLQDIPVIDSTTESGRRILMFHMDGDGAADICEFSPKRLTPEEIRDEIIKRSPFPYSISFIEGEVAPWGIYPKKSKRLEGIIPTIFNLPNVEPASHTFSHPFKWKKLEKKGKAVEGYSLNIPHYTFSVKREILGSIKYLQKFTDKKIRLLFWSGDCLPGEDALRLCYENGIFNLNGGDTTITKTEPWLSHISPMGIRRGDFWQIYAPMSNENVYTNLWHGPFYGFVRAIETIKMTEDPRRLKPIDVYYHFYSGGKLASINAIKKVSGYVSKLPTTPLFASDYIRRALGFYSAVLVKDLDGNYRVTTGGRVLKVPWQVKTLRIPLSWGLPTIKGGISGFKRYKKSRYVHIANPKEAELTFSRKKFRFYLIEADAIVDSFTASNRHFHLVLRGYVPLRAYLHVDRCRLFAKGLKIERQKDNRVYITSRRRGRFEIQAVCK